MRLSRFLYRAGSPSQEQGGRALGRPSQPVADPVERPILIGSRKLETRLRLISSGGSLGLGVEDAFADVAPKASADLIR